MKKHKYYFRDKIKLVNKTVLNVKFYKIFKKNLKLNKSIKQRMIVRRFKFNKNSINKIKKFCILTGKLRFIIHNHKFSRSVFREVCSFGLISGIFKK